MTKQAHTHNQPARRFAPLPAVLRTVATPSVCQTREAYAYAVESPSLSDELRGLGLGGGARRFAF